MTSDSPARDDERGPAPPPVTPERSRGTTSLTELALLFLRLGTTAFGGPAAHVAMMQDEVVKRRRWLTEERFLNLVGATNLIPGPNSNTELAMRFVAPTRSRKHSSVSQRRRFTTSSCIIATCAAFHGAQAQEEQRQLGERGGASTSLGGFGRMNGPPFIIPSGRIRGRARRDAPR